jgi:hypothetical protein
MAQHDYPELEGLINLCNDISEGRRDITWEDIFKEYGKIGYTNAKSLSKWLKENYEPPKSRKNL